MALILNIETATPVCSVALSRDGKLASLRDSTDEKSHATSLTIFIRQLLEENGITADQLDAISVGMGPGSYTGLRIGASVAKGLAFGSSIPVVGIPTLEALTIGFLLSHAKEIAGFASERNVLLCPMLDARRMEVYTALYDIALNEISPVEAKILDPESFRDLLENQIICFFGTGSNKATDLLLHPNARFFKGVELSAAYQSELAEARFNNQDFLDTAYFEPHYLKEFIASIPKNKVLGTTG
jgi:tRNA threonylcarbamoyladenosine biosynthesis protein TsaB